LKSIEESIAMWTAKSQDGLDHHMNEKENFMENFGTQFFRLKLNYTITMANILQATPHV
jgi:hypothetical protein